MKTYCIVTGSNSGIGKEVVLGLVAQGMHVVLACRSEIRAAEAIEQISKELENESDIGSLEFIPLDLNDLDSVRAFAESYLRKGYPLHLLINNAGISGPPETPLELTINGFEKVWQVNYLGHFLLTHLLMDCLKKSAPSRVINVSSSMHQLGSTDFKTASVKTTGARYATSKLAQLLFSLEFKKRFAESDKVDCVSVHPGGVDTNIWRWIHPSFMWLFNISVRKLFISSKQAANVVLFAASLPSSQVLDLKSVYVTPFREIIRSNQILNDSLHLMTCSQPRAFITTPSKKAEDENLAAQLWKFSEDSLAIKFSPSS